MQLIEGASASVEVVVTADMTAAAYARRPGERYPAVLATPVMIGEMERAAATLLEPLLAGGQLSVGAKIEVSHLSPTPIGAVVRSYARFAGREGALFWFEVWSEDPGGIVGKGRHARAIVDVAIIEEKAASRGPNSRLADEEKDV